ncbi:MAG TPA: type II CAAX endopeptidase family protein [Gaiellaceae bacterium]|nr:type II CAAX endopeptidase family protein [Gaiellaceae bacterium]
MSRRLVAWVLLVAAIAGVAYASRFAAGPPDRNILYRWSTTANELVVFGIIAAVTLAIARGERGLLALRRPRSWKRALGLGLLLLLVVYGAVAAVDPLLHGGREQGLTPTSWQPDHAPAFAANFFVIGAVAPFVEELLFRGLGYSLLERFGRVPAILVVGCSFAVYHGLVQALPELAIFGCALAWLRARTGSVLPGMLLHATFNSISLGAAVAFA